MAANYLPPNLDDPVLENIEGLETNFEGVKTWIRGHLEAARMNDQVKTILEAGLADLQRFEPRQQQRSEDRKRHREDLRRHELEEGEERAAIKRFFNDLKRAMETAPNAAGSTTQAAVASKALSAGATQQVEAETPINQDSMMTESSPVRRKSARIQRN